MTLYSQIKQVTGFSLGAMLALALVSCESEPESRFHWSPDGSRAGVLSNGTLHLVSKDGAIVETLKNSDEDPGVLEIQSFGWLPGPEGMWIHRTRTLQTWAEVRLLLPEEQVSDVERLSKAMPQLFSAMAACYDPESDSSPVLEEIILKDTNYFAALAHAMIEIPDALAESLEGSPELHEEFASDVEPPFEEWELHELVTLKGNTSAISGVTPAIPFLRSLTSFSQIKASPTLPILATTRSPGFLSDVVQLEVHSMDGSLHHQLGKQESEFDFAWSLDGLSLVIMSSQGDDELHSIRRRLLFHESGRKLTGEEEETTVLANMVSHHGPWLEVLSSNDILFSSTPSTFPTVLAEDSNEKPRLYRISESENAMKPIAHQADALPSDGHYVVSPDGKRVAIVETSSDAISVLELEGGQVTLVSPEHSQWKCRTLPAWRSNTELSFVALGPEGKSIQWQLWDAETLETRVLSDSWPETTTDGWLVRPDPEKTAPTEP